MRTADGAVLLRFKIMQTIIFKTSNGQNNSKDDIDRDQVEVKLKDLVQEGILWEASNSSMLAYSPCLRFAKMLMLISGGLGDICILILLSFEQTDILQILLFAYLHAGHTGFFFNWASPEVLAGK